MALKRLLHLKQNLTKIVEMRLSMGDIKLYALNGGTLAVSMTEIELWLKIFLLVVTIGYTLSKWHEIYKRKK
jgi:hypothetical protein